MTSSEAPHTEVGGGVEGARSLRGTLPEPPSRTVPGLLQRGLDGLALSGVFSHGHSLSEGPDAELGPDALVLLTVGTHG